MTRNPTARADRSLSAGLSKQEEHFGAILSALPEGILLCDSAGRITFCNPSAERILGLPAGQLIGKAFHEAAESLLCADGTPMDSGRHPVAITLRTGAPCSDMILRWTRPEGTLIWLSINSEPVGCAEEPTARKVVVTIRDVTGQRRIELALQESVEHLRLQARLQKAQRMESIGHLAGGLAHDFNNLLTVINGYATVALKELGPQHTLAEAIDEIRKAGEAAAELIRQLLAFSRKQMPHLEAVDVNAMLREMAPGLAALAGAPVQVRTVLAQSVKSVSADPVQIEQVIHNLAVHARDAMPQGGVLTIETKDVTRGPVCNHCRAEFLPGEYVCISVRDTGVAVDEGTRRQLFEPVFDPGTAGLASGLGLATVHGIVLQSGGHIDVESHPGTGTSFEIYLPAAEEISNSLGVGAAHSADFSPAGPLPFSWWKINPKCAVLPLACSAKADTRLWRQHRAKKRFRNAPASRLICC